MSDVILHFDISNTDLLSIGTSIIDFINSGSSYEPMFNYVSFTGDTRTVLLRKDKFNEIYTLIPDFQLAINSDNINQLLSEKNMKFISDIKVIHCVMPEEEALYYKMKNETLFSTLVTKVENYSGNILDYL